VGGFRDIEGTRPPDVSSTASCFRWSLKLVCGASQLEGFRGRCAGSLGGGAGGTVPGEISLSFSMLHHAVSRCVSASEVAVRCWETQAGRHKAGAGAGGSAGARPRCSVMDESSPKQQGRTSSGDALELRLLGGAGPSKLCDLSNSGRAAAARRTPHAQLLAHATKTRVRAGCAIHTGSCPCSSGP
jgi:hypothetical protein